MIKFREIKTFILLFLFNKDFFITVKSLIAFIGELLKLAL